MTSEAAANILNVKDNRYQILPTAEDIKVHSNEYINILALKEVTEAQNGTYICFVAKNGLTSLTFKSATVFIIQGTYNLLSKLTNFTFHLIVSFTKPSSISS